MFVPRLALSTIRSRCMRATQYCFFDAQSDTTYMPINLLEAEGKIQRVEVNAKVTIQGLTATEFNTDENKERFAEATKVRFIDTVVIIRYTVKILSFSTL